MGWVCLAAGAGQAADGGGTAAKHVLQVHGVVARGNADGSFVVDADRVLIHPAGREARFAPTRRKVVRLAVPGRLLDPAGESLPASRIREGAEVEALGPDEGVGAVLDAGIVVVHTAPAAGWCDLRSLAARPRAVRAVAPTPPLSRTSEPAAIGRPTVVHPTQRLSRAAARRVGGAASAQRAAHASRGTVLLTAPAWPAGGVCVARPAGSAMVARAAPARLHLPRTYPALTAFVLPAGGALADEGAHRVSPHAVPQHVFAPAADATAPRPAVPADARPIASAAPARGGGVPAFSLWAGVGSAPALRSSCSAAR